MLTDERYRVAGTVSSGESTGTNAVMPPSTTSVWPVMNELASDARNSTAAAMSSGCPNRPINCAASNCLAHSSLTDALSPGVSMMPGAMPLQRTPKRPYSVATTLTNCSSPPFIDEYAARSPLPARPLMDVVSTTEPPPASTMPGTTCLQPSMLPRSTTDAMRSQISTSAVRMSMSRLITAPPVGAALPCSTVIVPRSLPMRPTTSRHASSSTTSSTYGAAVPPAARISSATRPAESQSRSVTATAAPC